MATLQQVSFFTLFINRVFMGVWFTLEPWAFDTV